MRTSTETGRHRAWRLFSLPHLASALAATCVRASPLRSCSLYWLVHSLSRTRMHVHAGTPWSTRPWVRGYVALYSADKRMHFFSEDWSRSAILLLRLRHAHDQLRPRRTRASRAALRNLCGRCFGSHCTRTGLCKQCGVRFGTVFKHAVTVIGRVSLPTTASTSRSTARTAFAHASSIV